MMSGVLGEKKITIWIHFGVISSDGHQTLKKSYELMI